MKLNNFLDSNKVPYIRFNITFNDGKKLINNPKGWNNSSVGRLMRVLGNRKSSSRREEGRTEEKIDDERRKRSRRRNEALVCAVLLLSWVVIVVYKTMKNEEECVNVVVSDCVLMLFF